MIIKYKKLMLSSLLGFIVLLLVLLTVAGCAGKDPASKKGISAGKEFDAPLIDYPYTGDSATNVPSSGDQADDTSTTDSAKPTTLTAGDILALPACTVIPAEQIDAAILSECFVSYTISDEVFARIYGKSYVDNPYVTLNDLRYLKVLHYNFDHQIQVGELIVNVDLAYEFLDIFWELFGLEYEIYSMYLVDDIWTGDPITTDDVSCFLNNTSAFSYRLIPETGNLSKHAFGYAIDINPLQNPYVEYYNGIPWVLDPYSEPYIDRSAGHAHMITYDDDCFWVFINRGYIWGGDWWSIKDYQHFEK